MHFKAPRRLTATLSRTPSIAAALLTALAAGCASLPWETATPAAKPTPVVEPAPVQPAPVASAPVIPPKPVSTEPEGPPRKEVVFAVTADHRLLSFNAGQPARLLTGRQLSGLRTGEEILGIDFRVHKRVLYALGRTGAESRLLIIDTATARVTQVGTTPLLVPLNGLAFGFDFNPTVDRIRVVSDTGQNLRVHPDTGAVVNTDPKESGVVTDGRLVYDKADINAKRRPSVLAAAYTYNKNEKITTNFAIDSFARTLVIQGTREGVTPGVSPNSGRLFTVGSLQAGPFANASFDIADLAGTAFVATTAAGARESRFHLMDLNTGRATYLGRIGGGEAIVGIAVEP